eukprot:CAMPEP_0176313838 /NCGR_PEP_ID=MMETSP0121_2-20121125/67375_1 /TAXON_ID=160619 /ORGANISM="Kryptoperidinium foliaceum, Strain CCMP 1326" /LENGTH=120 /DNA_ID=CAMNT_0017655933 /DNA_START=78 /DNA_END=436 /DNA_ORIENTATION=+
MESFSDPTWNLATMNGRKEQVAPVVGSSAPGTGSSTPVTFQSTDTPLSASTMSSRGRKVNGVRRLFRRDKDKAVEPAMPLAPPAVHEICPGPPDFRMLPSDGLAALHARFPPRAATPAPP